MFVIFLCEIKARKSFAARTAAFDKDKKDGKFFQGSFFENSNFFKRLLKTSINFSVFLAALGFYKFSALYKWFPSERILLWGECGILKKVM